MEVFCTLPPRSASRTALTIGKFDGVHLGHRSIIERLIAAAIERGLPSCALTFDPHPAQFFLKDQAPSRLTTLAQKVRLLEECGLDRLYVCPFNETMARMSPESFVQSVLIRQLGARWILVGNDFRFGAGRTADVEGLRTLGKPSGLEVATAGLLHIDGCSVSSTAIRAAIANGDWATACRLLGRNALRSPERSRCEANCTVSTRHAIEHQGLAFAHTPGLLVLQEP